MSEEQHNEWNTKAKALPPTLVKPKANTDESGPKFKQISGSLKNAFGIQRVIPVVEQPKGTTVLSLNFSPSPAPSVTNNMKQQTTETEQKNLDLKSEIDEGDSAKSNSKEVMDAKELSEQIKSEVSSQDVKVETVNDKVLVSLNTENKTADEIKSLMKTNTKNLNEKNNELKDANKLLGFLKNEKFERLFKNPKNIKLVREAMFASTNEIRGTSYSSRIEDPKYQFAGKTGTTNELRDSWFAGFDQNTVTVTWLGRDDNKIAGLTGGQGALEVYIRYLKELNPESIADQRPASIKWAFVSEQTGQQAPPGCGNVVNLPVRANEFVAKPACR